MSRVGKKPIAIPAKTTITYKDGTITVKGSKGTLTHDVHPAVDLKIEKDQIDVVIPSEDRKTRAFQGMTRSIISNMVVGVNEGYERVLEINGIG